MLCYYNAAAGQASGTAIKAHIGMKWFRSNIKHGSRLALLALAVQFVFAFGHFHAVAAPAAPAIQSGPAQPGSSDADRFSAPDTISQSAQQQPVSHHDQDQQPNDACAICAVIAFANTGLSATPPSLLLPHAVEFSYLTSELEFVHLNSARVAFQPRAPPIS
jgi:hypothetical protein